MATFFACAQCTYNGSSVEKAKGDGERQWKRQSRNDRVPHPLCPFQLLVQPRTHITTNAASQRIQDDGRRRN